MDLSTKVSALGIDPQNAQAAFEFGLRARKSNSEREALPILQKSAAMNPHHAGLWQVLGLCHRALDELEPALNAFRRAASLAPHDALISHGHARVALEAGLPATQLFDLARKLAPTDGAVLVGRSAAQLADGKLADAIADLDSALFNSPDWQDGHAAVSRLRWMMGDHDRFTDSIEHALKGAPTNPNLWSQLILTQMQARQHAKVLKSIDLARRSLGQSDAFLLLEACCLAELEQYQAADTLFSAIGDVNDPILVEHRIRHLLRARRVKEASAFGDKHIGGPMRALVLPYASIAWRMLEDERWTRLINEPDLLGVYDIADQLPPQDQLTEKLRKLHSTLHEPMEQSLRGGSQTDGPLLSIIDPVIQSLRRAITEAVTLHVGKLTSRLHSAARSKSDIRFTGSWSVLLRGSGHHANHIHQAGWLSSALYVALPSQAQMGSAPAGWFTLGQPPVELKLELPPIRTIEPKYGRLVLFPSTMWHGTNPITAGERMTVAFDVAPLPKG